jgi:hypothetical protein
MRALIKWAVLAAAVAAACFLVLPRVRSFQADASAEASCRQRCQDAAMAKVDECERDQAQAAVSVPAACLNIAQEEQKRCRETCEKR